MTLKRNSLKEKVKYAILRRKLIAEYVRRFGSVCQSCRAVSESLDFSHKTRASQLGPTTNENGQAICRVCHAWLHRSRDREDLAASDFADLNNGSFIIWPQYMIESLYQVKLTGTDRLGKVRMG